MLINEQMVILFWAIFIAIVAFVLYTAKQDIKSNNTKSI